MKKYATRAFPFAVLCSVVLLVFAFVSLAYNKTLFTVELILALVGVLISVIIYFKYSAYIR